MLHKLAAVKVIRELEEQEIYHGRYGPAVVRILRPLRNIKEEITNLALNHG